MPGKRWSPHEVQSLKRWYCIEGRSRQWIAQQLGRSMGGVVNKIDRLHLTRNKPTSGPHRSKTKSAKQLLNSITNKYPYLKTPKDFMDFLEVDLHDYQWDGWQLIDENARTILCWNRQAGKDMLLSLYGLYLALTEPGAKIICVSPSDRQSKLWMEKVQEFVYSKTELKDRVTDISKSEIRFENTSRLISLPGGMEKASTIRGYSNVSLIVFNEAAYIEEEVFHGTTPFLAANPDSKAVLISTPFGTLGYFYRMWESDLFAHSLVRAEQCPHISQDFLDAERISMPALEYASEYECQFLSTQTAFFPTELLQSVTKSYQLAESPPERSEGEKVFLGFDPARVKGGDKSVITIISEKDGYGKVLWIKEFEDIPYPEQCGYVKFLYDKWRFDQIFVDKSAHAVVDLLKNYRLPVTPMPFTLQGKIELFGRLKNAMEAGAITIPSHPNLHQELSTFEYKITDAGNITLHGSRDDYVDSLALASSDLTKPKVGFSASLVDFSAAGQIKAIYSMDEWKEHSGLATKDPLKRGSKPQMTFYPWREEGGGLTECVCGEPIMGPRTLIWDTYVDANHPECHKIAKKEHRETMKSEGVSYIS